ncbi:MAG: VIT1/CCC1 transporter family protein [Nitrococcus mobilis]|nr:VIT1/CCC1 transporter family protein [Nitrococcus mobilis]
MQHKKDLKRLRENLQREIDSAALYDALSEVEDRPQLKEIYARMARLEEHHARFWRVQLGRRAAVVPQLGPTWRSRVLIRLARRFGAELVLPTAMRLESAERGSYKRQPESRHTRLPSDESYHRRLLRAISATVGQQGIEGAAIARMEGRHDGIGGNALRAAVLGANDGLVSNLSLIMGVAGASVGSQTILITGLAGLLAGAISMALGEWISVTSSRELYEQQIRAEAEELTEMPEEEEAELTLIYQAKGLPEEEAKALAARLIADKDNALNTLAREELGIDPHALGGSPKIAAFASFMLFAVGASLPVLPFFFLTGLPATGASLLCSAFGLFGIGAAITLLTGRSALHSGIRQLLFGMGAAALTYGIGWMFGVTLTG